MKLKLSIFFTLFFLSTHVLLACVFDTSNTTLEVSNNRVTWSSSFHPFQIDYLLRQNGRSVSQAENFMRESDFIEWYISENLRFYNSGSLCPITQISLLEVDAVNIFFEWVKVSYTMECESIIEEASVLVDFFSEVWKQTNMLRVIYWENPRYQLYEPLDPDYPELSFNILTHEYVFEWSFLDNTSAQILYENNSDNKFQTNTEDVFCNEMDAESFWFTHLWDMSMCEILNDSEIINPISSSLMDINREDNFIVSLYNRVYMQLQRGIVEWNIWVIGLSFIVFMLWFLHAAGPGHSKSILAALMLNKDNSFWSWLKYIISYTLTHYIDIIVFSVIVSLFLYSFDITQYYTRIQVISAFILLGLSVYLIIKSIKALRHWRECICCKSSSGKAKWPILLWIFAWIVPCMLAWTLFFLLTSLWLLHYLFFIILALILWTFTFLFWLLVLIQRIRCYWFLRFHKYLSVTPLFSACLLFVISLSIFYVNL